MTRGGRVWSVRAGRAMWRLLSYIPPSIPKLRPSVVLCCLHSLATHLPAHMALAPPPPFAQPGGFYNLTLHQLAQHRGDAYKGHMTARGIDYATGDAFVRTLQGAEPTKGVMAAKPRLHEM